MPGQGDKAGPPVHVLDRVPDRAALEEFVGSRSPPFRVGYRQGEDVVEEEFERVDTSRGGGLGELHYADGRHVTVDVAGEMERIEEVSG